MTAAPDVTVAHAGCVCDLLVGRYENGRPALELRDRATGEPLCRATTNLPDEPLGPDEVFVKDYSENRGVLASLQAAGVVGAPVRRVRAGFVEIPACRLLVPVPA